MSRSDGSAGRRGTDLDARARRRAASTAGIHRLDDRGRWRPVGGGVCLRLAGRAFVLSAGHVMMRSGQPLWLGGRHAVVPLAGAAVIADGPDAPPEIATLDAAFGLLAAGDADALAGDVEFLSLADVDADHETGSDTYYAVAAPTLAERAAASSPPLPAEIVRLRQAPFTDYRRHGVVSATHLVLRPAPGAPPAQSASGGSDTRWPAERWRGCGIWRASGGRTGDRLAGIVIHASGGEQPRIVATRPCFAVLGIMGCLGAGLPEPAAVRRPN